MFSAVEESYLKGLIESYRNQGYRYYLAHTVTETNNNYDMYVYFSKKEIKAITSTMFDMTNAVCLRVDSSSRNDNSYNGSTHSRIDIFNSSYSNVLSVNQAEFIYTNAEISYTSSNIVVQPDIEYSVIGSTTDFAILFVLIISFLFTFVLTILRLKR